MDGRAALTRLTDADRSVVERLWQLYKHDMSAHLGWWHDPQRAHGTLPNSEGLYKQDGLTTYFGHPDEHDGYLISYDGAPVGFAFVSGLSGPIRSIGDFFVVRGVRRKNIGHAAARALIDRHPGPWEIAFQGTNQGAPEFWRRVATDTVGTDWREELRPVPGKPDIPPDHWVCFTVPARDSRTPRATG